MNEKKALNRIRNLCNTIFQAFFLLDRNWWKYRYLQIVGVSDEIKEPAGNDSSEIFRRNYSNYKAYILHQKSKLDFLTSGGKFKFDGTNLERYDILFRESLSERLKKMEFINENSNVLCLAARIGTEVKAFHDCGYFAVGVDLNPGRMNEYVLYGDFNKLVFPDSSVDIIYCNSFDHAYSLDLLLSEIKRLLRPSGLLIAEVQFGESEGNRSNSGYWESIYWNDISDLQSVMNNLGFHVERGMEFSYPWPGIQLLAKHGPSKKIETCYA